MKKPTFHLDRRTAGTMPPDHRAATRARTKWMPAGLAHDDKCVAHHRPPPSSTTPKAHKQPPSRGPSHTLIALIPVPATTLTTLSQPSALRTFPAAPSYLGHRPVPPPHPRRLHLSARYIAALLHGVTTPRLLEGEVAETKGVGGEGVLAEIPRKKAPPRPLALQRILAEECHAPGRAGVVRWVLSMPPTPPEQYPSPNSNPPHRH